MTPKARLALIMTQLQQKKTLSLHDILTLTGTSRDTARRDMLKLAERQLVERNYGGISLPQTFRKLDQYLDRENDLLPTKRALARRASQLLTDQHLLFLDVSTTVTCLPQYLTANDDGVLITNSLDIADQALRHSTYRTHILGGPLNAQQRCVQGAESIFNLTKFKFDTAVLSCAGLAADGVYYAYENDIALKQVLRQQSKHLMLLVDHTKFNVTHNFNLLSSEDFDTIVTDWPLPADLAAKIPATKVKSLKEVSHDS